MANENKFSERLVTLIGELGGSCSESESTLENLLRTIKLPSLFEIEIIASSLGEGDFKAIKSTHDPKTDESQSQLITFLNERTKTFFFSCASPMNAIGQGGWAPETPEDYARKIIKGDELTMLEVGFWDGSYPDSFFVCLTDPNPMDPIIYATDHECLFQVDNISNAGPMSEFLDQFVKVADINETLIDKIAVELSPHGSKVD